MFLLRAVVLSCDGPRGRGDRRAGAGADETASARRA